MNTFFAERKQEDLARSAFKFWTENSCLEWKENCAEKPVIMISELGGCFSHIGPQSRATQPMSLSWNSCGGF
ncbi:hypothetical protein AAVH_17333, partial [Aphelenchoides avenae]